MDSSKIRYLFCLVIILLISCDTGYQQENNKWVWISYNEAVGKSVSEIDEHDFESFKVLENENYAKDLNSVFYTGSKILFADPNTFEIIRNGYSRDKNRVYLDNELVVLADPKTFKLLEFPYSKDDSNIFCGTIPLKLSKNEVDNFIVTNSNGNISSMKTSMTLSYFIDKNQDYKWLDTMKINGVIVGEWATGKSLTKNFDGFKEIKN